MVNTIELDSASKLMKTLVDNTPVAYIVLDRHYRIRYINQSFAALRGLNVSEIIGEKCYSISNGGNRCDRCAVAQTLQTGEKAFVPRKDILPDGSVRFIDDYAMPLQFDAEGNVEFVLEMMVNRTQEMLAREQRDKDYTEILSALSVMLESKDLYTAEHSDSVRRLAVRLAKRMGLSADEVFEISVAASLHDIGKVAVPESIINKPGKLTQEEYEIIKSHSTASDQMLEGFSSFDRIRQIARHHHERVDGKGYPDGLTGDQLSAGAKIIATVDTYDAITSTRSYRKALSHEFALQEMQRVAGTQLDEDTVNAFVGMEISDEDDMSRENSPVSQDEPVERVLKTVLLTSSEPNLPPLGGIDLEHLLCEILANTPCGYLLMDRNRIVLYASDYFLSGMGTCKENVIGNPCFNISLNESGPCKTCFVEEVLQCKQTKFGRREIYVQQELRIFDVFGVPLIESSGEVSHVIEILIDRTAEEKMQRARKQDFHKLVDMLTEVYEKQNSDLDVNKLSREILTVKMRLSQIP